MAHEDLVNLPVIAAMSPQKCYCGIVRKVGADFLLVDDPEMGMALVALEHIKQLRVGEGVPVHKPPQIDAASAPLDPGSLPDALHGVVRTWVASVLQLDGAGPDPIVVYVIDVKADYLVVSAIPDGVLYIPVRHIQLVRPLDVQIQPEFVEWANHQKEQLPTGATRLIEALEQEVGKLAKFGRGGADEVVGIIRAVHEQFVELVVSPCERVRIPMHHVKSVSRPGRLNAQASPGMTSA
ncbi:hypothetical protein [Alicyclobacillus shizuokensis]|uniref:hypothetical protein n=1 Tax=Alicyclobacillus shizuokensis TaxID=392014 RepID=UPI00082A3AFB|nr:hypothetical protein [Alicyclobacillus shizuokensis]